MANQPDNEKNEIETAPKKPWLSWDRGIELAKIAATLYVALIGTFVTMQFNERQHELARIEAIAQMLPSLASKEAMHSGKDSEGSGSDGTSKSQAAEAAKNRMVRDGAIWAIFRTANNKNMLRDLAALFPEDIYRVVSSIAASGSLEHDADEMTALQIASEKLANKYLDENQKTVAARLYNQALRLKQQTNGESGPLHIVDLNDKNIETGDAGDEETALLRSLNNLGNLHKQESDVSKKVNTGHWQAKQLFSRVRKLGADSESKEVQIEVAHANMGLAHLYEKERRSKTAIRYLQDALKLQESALGENDPAVAQTKAELKGLEATMAAEAQESKRPNHLPAS